MQKAIAKTNVARSTATVEEAAQRLGIGKNRAYEGVRQGEIPTIRIGKRILVPLAALERLLADRIRRPRESCPSEQNPAGDRARGGALERSLLGGRDVKIAPKGFGGRQAARPW